MVGNPVLAFQDRDGLLFYRADQIATLTPEYRGRWRAVTAAGEVVHRPGRPRLSWPRLGSSLVNPGLLRAVGNGWEDPGEFRYEGDPGPAFEPLCWPEVPGLSLSQLEFWGVEVQADGQTVWRTDRGPVASPVAAGQLAELHPRLICCGKQWWINPDRLRRLRRQLGKYEVILDNGEVLVTLSRAPVHRLISGLGLKNPDRLGDAPCLLTERNLREYPTELDVTSGPQLRKWFQTPRQALSNIIYQTVRYRQQGKVLDGYGTEHSGYLYKPVFSVMVRAGFWKSEAALRMDLKLRAEFESVVNDLIGRDRLFTYQDLGFLDDPARRHIGDRRPEIVLVFEKTGFRGYAEELSRRYGVSYILTGGLPKLLESEFLAAALARVVRGPVRIIAFTDFDPGGWVVAEALAEQLLRYGAQIIAPGAYLVRAEGFTREELELFAFDCPMGNASAKTLALNWTKRSGGIDGKPRGMHANHFKPLERVATELEKYL